MIPATSIILLAGPVYSYNDMPLDQEVANIQTALQQQGYYQGDIDGLIGPQTRAALAQYQQANGLEIDIGDRSADGRGIIGKLVSKFHPRSAAGAKSRRRFFVWTPPHRIAGRHCWVN